MTTSHEPGRDGWVAAAIGVALFAVYAVGACRTIYVGDSGELVAAVDTLGIPHPSGYPLYVLMGKMWTLLVPIGSIALRMSLFSAACAATACAVLFLVCREAEIDRAPALLAASLLAFSPSFWSQANIQRVYALNALVLVLVTLAALSWWRTRTASNLYLAAFLCGLGASNHLFMAIVWLVLMAWVVSTEPTISRRPKALAASVAATGCGLLPYLYLPLRSAANPRLDWGNPETFGAFLEVVTRRGFWQRRWIEGVADLVPIATDWLANLAAELAWAGPVLAVIAILGRRRLQLPVALPVAIALANAATLALHGSRSDIFIWHRYLIPAHVMVALLAGAGAQVLTARLPRRWSTALLLLPVALFITGFGDFDRSRYRIAEDFSRRLLGGLPPGATLVASDDNILFVLIYLQLVEQVRPDVDLVMQGVGKADLRDLRFDPQEDPVFFTHHPNWKVPDMAIVPTGLAFRIWRHDLPALETTVEEPFLDGELEPRVPKDYLTRNLIGHFHFMRGLTLEEAAWTEAEIEFRRARGAAARNDVLFHNLGLVYRRSGLYLRALAAFRQAHDIDPRRLASETSAPLARAQQVEADLSMNRAALRAIPSSVADVQSTTPGSAEYHRRTAALLETAGREQAAHGHLCCAEEIDAGITDPGPCDAL